MTIKDVVTATKAALERMKARSGKGEVPVDIMEPARPYNPRSGKSC